MHRTLLYFVALFFSIFLPIRAIEFKSEALSKKTKCEQLTKSDCLFYHEAIDNCAEICEKRIKEGDKEDDGGKKKPDDAEDGDKKKKGGGGGKCFHGSALVHTESSGMILMRDLVRQTGVKVLSLNDDGKMSFSEIYYWIHANEQKEENFLLFNTSDKQSLSITGEHLIYVTECKLNVKNKLAVRAERVKVGHCLFVSDPDGELKVSKVVSIGSERKRGIYAPITRNGNLVVDGVLASSFVSLENEKLQKIMYHYIDVARKFLTILTPSGFVQMFYSNHQSANTITIPEVIFSFWDLGKIVGQ